MTKYLAWVIAVCCCITACNNSTSQSGGTEPSSDKTVQLTSYCALSFDDVGSLLGVYAHSDAEALAGLLARGKVIELKKGTKVFVAGEDNGVDTVLVESGFHSGEKCWIWGKFVR